MKKLTQLILFIAFFVVICILLASCKTYKANDLRQLYWTVDSVENGILFAHSRSFYIEAYTCDTFEIGCVYRLVEDSKGEIKRRKSE